MKEEAGRIFFELNIELKDSFREGFRVFAPDKGHTERLNTNCPRNNQGPVWLTTIYTDGSYIGNGMVQAIAGAELWYRYKDQRNEALRLSAYLNQTNNTGEALAILRVVQKAPSEDFLKITSNSKLIIDSMTTHLYKHKDNS